MIWWLIKVALFVIPLASAWKLHAKAGQPGWVGIVPVLNILGLLKMVGRPYWMALLLLIPFVNVAFLLLLSLWVAKSFGKSGLFGLGLFFLAPLFVFLLGFGSAQYQGPAAAQA